MNSPYSEQLDKALWHTRQANHAIALAKHATTQAQYDATALPDAITMMQEAEKMIYDAIDLERIESN